MKNAEKIALAKNINKALNGEAISGNPDISPELLRKVNDVLSDEEKLKRILESNEAKAIIKALGGS